MAEMARGATDVDGRKRANASGVRQGGGQSRVPLTRCAPGLMLPRVPASRPADVANTAASPPQRQLRDRQPHDPAARTARRACHTTRARTGRCSACPCAQGVRTGSVRRPPQRVLLVPS